MSVAAQKIKYSRECKHSRR